MRVQKQISSSKGATQVEYALIMAMLVTLIPVIGEVGRDIGNFFTRVNSELEHAAGGGSNSTSGATLTEEEQGHGGPL